jgi:hypothetical protein
VHNTDNLHAFGNNAVKDEIRGLDENPGFPVEPRPERAGFGKLLEGFKPSPQSPVNSVCGSGIDVSKFEPKFNEIATSAVSVTDLPQV